jgi:hypothetical protein
VAYRALIVVAMALYAGTAWADERTASLINSFRVFCTLTTLNFSALDAKASAMKLPLVEEVGEPQHEGPFLHSKSWAMELTTRTHTVVATEARGANSEFVICGIYATDSRGEDAKQELMKQMNLGNPTDENIADGPQRLTKWRTKMGSGDAMLLLAALPDAPGFQLTLLQPFRSGQ